MRSTMKIAKTFRFDAAHRLVFHPGKCGCLHGHTYTVTLEVEGPIPHPSGMVLDFYDLKKYGIEPVMDAMDHAVILNTIDPLCLVLVGNPSDMALGPRRGVLASSVQSKAYIMDREPTAEFIAGEIAAIVRSNFLATGQDVKVSKVIVRETPDTYAEYEPR